MQETSAAARQARGRPDAVAVPADSRIAGRYPTTQLADAYAITLPPDASLDPERLARFVLSRQPAWVARLMALRDALMRPFGLKTSRQLRAAGDGQRDRRIGIFRIYETTPDEIILGEDDKHLDFRVSVMVRPPQLIVSTVVHCHNRLGRAYILLIAPFHRAVVRANLRQAARGGWPGA